MKDPKMLGYVRRWPDISRQCSQRAVRAIAAAVCSRGDRIGLIKRSAPKYGTDGWLAWQALMSNIAPVRCAFWSVAFHQRTDADADAIYDQIDRWAESHLAFVQLVLQRPLEFNLTHFHASAGAAESAEVLRASLLSAAGLHWRTNKLRQRAGKRGASHE